MILNVEDFTVRYSGTVAVQDVNFAIGDGEVVGIVGESGAGKSTLGLALLGLAGERAGSIRFGGRELVDADDATLQTVRGSGIGLVSQDTGNALHPAYTVGEQIAESIDGKRRGWQRRHDDTIRSLLKDMELDPVFAREYPHELSGGQKQRALFALALAGSPDLLIADEPTSSLDTVTEARIIDLLEGIANKKDLSVLLITHDLGVVAETCARTLIMRAGRIVNRGTTVDVLSGSGHEYTNALVEAYPDPVPTMDGGTADFDSGTQPTPVVAELDSVTKQYRKSTFIERLAGNERRTTALRDVSLSIHAGETVALVGQSGAGKTTAARLLAGLETPTSGAVRLHGETVGHVKERPQRLREALGYVFQSPTESLDPRRRVIESLVEPLKATNMAPSEYQEKGQSLLSEVGLDGYCDRVPGDLSGGEAQRVALARALVTDPDLLVLDEATSALDTVTAEQICTLTERLGRAVFAVTHDIGIARRLADRIIVLHDGQAVDRGPTLDLLSDPGDDRTRELVAAAPTIP